MAKVIGNRGQQQRSQGQGYGISQTGPVLGSFSTVIGEKDEVVYLPTQKIVPNQYEDTVAVQSTAAVSLRYTLRHYDISANPDPVVRGSGVWSPAQVLAAGAIVQANSGLPFVVVEITFTAAGEVYFVAR